MSVPIEPSISMSHQLHYQIDQFIEDIRAAVESAQKNNGHASEDVVVKLASNIEKLEANANQVLREGNRDDELIIDAQILLGIITQEIHPDHLEDREVTMLRAARDFNQKSNDDLIEVIKTFSENEEDREQLMMTVDRISHEVFLRCDKELPIGERKSA